MSIRFVKGDATHPQLCESEHHYLVHIVNNEGRFGKGFTHSLGMRFPGARKAYYRWFDTYRVMAGTQVIDMLGKVCPYTYDSHLTILHLCAQNGLRKKLGDCVLDYSALTTCLFKVRCLCLQHGEQLATVHMPRMGAGLAGGEWSKIQSIINEQLCTYNIPVFVYDYQPRQ